MNILTPTGYIAIEDAVLGTEVVYYDLQTGEQLINTLVSISRIDKAIWEETYANSETGSFDFYLINGAHRLFKEQSVWVNLHVFHVSDLQIGDIIYDDADGDIEITSIEKVEGTDQDEFWLLHVTGDHSYIADGLTFHNATYYARNVSGNWSANTSWDSASSGGAGPAGPPTTLDSAIFDSGHTGTITVDGSRICIALTAQAGATGTLAFGTGNLTIGASGFTTVTGFHITGTTGKLTLTNSMTITTGGLSIPNIVASSNGTYTMGDDLNITGSLTSNSAAPTFAGAHDIYCATLGPGQGTGGITIKWTAGRKLTVSTSIILHGSSGVPLDIASGTVSSVAYLVFTGAASALACAGVNFTDIDFSTYSTPVTNLDNWYGGTLTRTVGITNRTSADFATAAQASHILDDTIISGITGTIATQTLSAVNDTVAAGYYAATTLSTVDTDLVSANIKSGVTIFGKAGAATVQDVADADLTVGEAPTGKKFYAVSGGVKTGTGTKTLSAANDTVDAGYYAATTLSVVDTDLAVGNIASGTVIFGFAGTHSGGSDIFGVIA